MTFAQKLHAKYKLEEIATEEPEGEEADAILRKRFNEKDDQSEYALLDHKGKKVLRWFGAKKPSKERVNKAERSVQFWKHHG